MRNISKMIKNYGLRLSNITTISVLILVSLGLGSCKKFLEIPPPTGSLEQGVVFKNDAQATSAVLGMYAGLNNTGFASGATTSISFLTGISSDEFIGYNLYLPFYDNQLSATTNEVMRLYSNMYQSVYRANVILEGIASSEGMTPTAKAQLQGEAYFVRAFTNFYLLNIFGPIPLQLTTNYLTNQQLSRSSTDIVYKQILDDLLKAERLLGENYPSAGKVRPNKSVVQSLISRTYLFTKDWENAEKYASLVIQKNGTYDLVPYNDVFLANSREAIWQLEPQAGRNAPDGTTFIPVLTTIPTTVSIRPEFVTSGFLSGDKRLTSWIRSYVVNGVTYYHPFKYKIASATTATEYSTVFRLAEQYLIRAEARINNNNIVNGISDLNKVRLRTLENGQNANTVIALPDNLNKQDALYEIESERKRELFSEWGHRWLDIKRTERVNLIMTQVKPLWQPHHRLYPLPSDEVIRNKNIYQNQGY